jgi:flagellar basal-body rod protein FlgC
MGLFDAMNATATGLVAEQVRMDTVAANLANADSTRQPNGAPGPYVRRVVELSSSGQVTGGVTPSFATFGDFMANAGTPGGVQVVGIVNDTSTPFGLKYDPSSPDANAKGYVRTPNVNPVTEMTDLITATRSYEANATAMGDIKQEFSSAINVLR